MPLVFRHSNNRDAHNSITLHREIDGQPATSNLSNSHSNNSKTATIMIGKKPNNKSKVPSAAASIFGVLMIAGALRATAFSFAKSSSTTGRFARPALTRLSSTTADATSTDNPLLQQDDLPKFSKIEPKDLTPAVNTLLEKLDKDFETFESKIQSTETPAYDEVLPVLEKMQFGLGFTWGVAGHLNGVKNGDELRSAYEENQPKVVQAMTKFSQSKPLYDALEAIEKEWEASGESKTDDFVFHQKQRAVEGSLLGMKLGGVGLEGEEKEKFNEMKMKLADISTKFSNNVLDASKVFSLTVEDASKMEGVPESAKAMWAQSHAMHLKSESEDKDMEMPKVDPEAGPWRISHDMPSYIAAMQHLPDREIREQIYRAYISRAGEQMEDKNNVPYIYEILKIKAEMSKMLGFANHAERSLATKMAPSVESVSDLSDLILKTALPAAERELVEITAYAREHGGEEYKEENLEKLMPWDTTFWSERLKESKFDLKEEDLRPYFALPNVLDGMFGLLERLFGVRVEEAKDAAEVWHPDVQFFKVFDIESEKHIASFYLDPFSRPANKRGGAWMDVCIGKSEALNRDVPVAYLTCNGSPPVGDKPSLMTFREVETLFHETGKYRHSITNCIIMSLALLAVFTNSTHIPPIYLKCQDTDFSICSLKPALVMSLVSMELNGMLSSCHLR